MRPSSVVKCWAGHREGTRFESSLEQNTITF